MIVTIKYAPNVASQLRVKKTTERIMRRDAEVRIPAAPWLLAGRVPPRAVSNPERVGSRAFRDDTF